MNFATKVPCFQGHLMRSAATNLTHSRAAAAAATARQHAAALPQIATVLPTPDIASSVEVVFNTATPVLVRAPTHTLCL
jgi:hypothetical protein